MKIVTRCAFASALLGLAQACANPVDVQGCAQDKVSSNCDVILAAASDFAPGDAGAMAGQSGATGTDGLNGPAGNAGAGGSSSAELGSGGNPALQPGQGGTSNSSQSGTGVGAAGTGSAGTASAGAGGGGGAAGTSSNAGAGGGVAAGGTAGTGAAGTGAAGTAGTGTTVTINPANCDFTDTTGCDNLVCATACPTNNGDYCVTTCQPIIDCIEQSAPLCVTAADPLCAKRSNGGGVSACTTLVEKGGSQTDPKQPAAVALGYVQCLCAATRP